MSNFWQSGARLPALRARATLYAFIRQFFAERSVLEVAVPALGRTTTPDALINSIEFQDEAGQSLYLQTSPEHFLKRLLASVQIDLYSLGPAFRQGEQGDWHNAEFCLLEWYRCGYDCEQLMAEVAEFINLCLGSGNFTQISYRALLRQVWQADVLALSPDAQVALSQAALASYLPADAVLDALYAEALRRHPEARFFVTEFPPDQAAMAALVQDAQGHSVAARFECIVDGLELANGYRELTDRDEQSARWAQEARIRKQRGLPEVPTDDRLLAALPCLPDCSGVALGIDRLLMLQIGEKKLDAVLSFSTNRL